MVMMLNFGIVVVELFIVIFLFYTNSFLLKRRKKEFGLYSVLGMEKSIWPGSSFMSCCSVL